MVPPTGGSAARRPRGCWRSRPRAARTDECRRAAPPDVSPRRECGTPVRSAYRGQHQDGRPRCWWGHRCAGDPSPLRSSRRTFRDARRSTMERTAVRTTAQVLFVALVVSACAAGGGSATSPDPVAVGDKSGGRAATVLTLGTNDTPGDASADYIRRFAADLDRISGGLLTIDIKYRAAGENILRYDQRIAEMVRAGDVDLGLVPA